MSLKKWKILSAATAFKLLQMRQKEGTPISNEALVTLQENKESAKREHQRSKEALEKLSESIDENYALFQRGLNEAQQAQTNTEALSILQRYAKLGAKKQEEIDRNFKAFRKIQGP